MTDTTSSWINIGDTINTWSDLAGLVEKYRANRWIFRGVTNKAHALIPTIGRPGTRKDLDSGEDKPYDEDKAVAMFERFKREARPHLRHAATGWLEWLAIAQHHGLGTPLLDWSDSPLVAAYFAVEPAGIIRGVETDAALYGIGRPHVVESDFEKWPDGQDVVAYYPPHLTPRITTQRGLFTIHRIPDVPWTPIRLRKWVIPSEVCIHIKLALHRAGVNRASLFPDTDGIAMHINWLHKWGIE
jgi:hypothetical protein